MSESLRLLLTKERPERIAHIALYKRAAMSDLLRSLMTKERKSKLLDFFEQITHSLFCAQKISHLQVTASSYFGHRHISVKVPNDKFDFNPCVDRIQFLTHALKA